MAETVHVLCDNGSVMEHDLPLPPGIADRVARGDLRLVNADGSQLSDATPAEESDEMPSGTVPAVLDWVGEDPDRALRALDAEQAKGDKARATLVAALTALLEQSTE